MKINKSLIERKIQEKIYFDSLNEPKDFIEDMYNYFSNYFSIQEPNEYIKVEKTEENLFFTVLEHVLEAKVIDERKIEIYTYINDNSAQIKRLGEIDVRKKKFSDFNGYNIHSSKEVDFKKDLYERFIYEAFKSLT